MPPGPMSDRRWDRNYDTDAEVGVIELRVKTPSPKTPCKAVETHGKGIMRRKERRLRYCNTDVSSVSSPTFCRSKRLEQRAHE